MQSKNCYIHIGAPKTGSTALQVFLSKNRKLLLEKGLLYPEGASRAHGHHDLAFLMGGGYPDWAIAQEKTLEQLLTELAVDVQGHSGDIFIDSENFYLYPHPDRLASALEKYNIIKGRGVKILVYVRPQIQVHESWYNQIVKAQGFVGSIEDSIAMNWTLWDYEKRLAPWAETFGLENILVRQYGDKEIEQWNIVNDVELLLGFSFEALDQETRINTRLNRDTLEFQLVLNRLPISIVEKRTFHCHLMALSEEHKGTGLFDENPYLSYERCVEIMGKYAASNKAVAETYLKTDCLFPKLKMCDEKPFHQYEGLQEETRKYIANVLMKSAASNSCSEVTRNALKCFSGGKPYE